MIANARRVLGRAIQRLAPEQHESDTQRAADDCRGWPGQRWLTWARERCMESGLEPSEGFEHLAVEGLVQRARLARDESELLRQRVAELERERDAMLRTLDSPSRQTFEFKRLLGLCELPPEGWDVKQLKSNAKWLFQHLDSSTVGPHCDTREEALAGAWSAHLRSQHTDEISP